MAHSRRKTPQKALTRKDFRYKRDWKYYKENEQEENKFEENYMKNLKREVEEVEEDEVDQTEAGLMVVFGLLLTFFKMIELGGSSLGNPFDNFDIVLNYGLGFLTVAGINAVGQIMKGAESEKIQFTSMVLKSLSYFAFVALFVLLTSNL